MTTCAVCGRTFDQERHSYEAVCEDCQLKATLNEMTVAQALENVRRGCGGRAEADVLGRELVRLGELEKRLWNMFAAPEDLKEKAVLDFVFFLMGKEAQTPEPSCSTPGASG